MTDIKGDVINTEENKEEYVLSKVVVGSDLSNSKTLTFEQVLKNEGILVQTTFGVSMFPLLRNGKDNVVIKPCEKLNKGDVAFYKVNKEKYILHRVINVKPDLYIIRGDNTYRNERVLPKQILGVAVGFYRKDKYISVESRGFKFYSWLWRVTYPVRFIAYKIYRFFTRIIRRLRRTNNETKS